MYGHNSVSLGLPQYAIYMFRQTSVRPVGQTLLTGPSIHAGNAIHHTYSLTHITHIIISITLVIIFS